MREETPKRKMKYAHYLLPTLFFMFVALFAGAQLAKADQAASMLDSRPLAQMPRFTLASAISGDWMEAFGRYLTDQLWLRDDLVQLHSLLESAQGKLEGGGVWFAEDGYLIAKNDVFSPIQATKYPINVTAVTEFSARHPGRVTLMVVPSPANILSELLPFAPPQIDENAMLDDLFAQAVLAGARVVDLRDAFNAQQNDYIYYRTDHHWTTTGGAYIAYGEFCRLRGIVPQIPPAPLVEVPGFLGSNYVKSKAHNAQADLFSFYNIDTEMTVYRQLADGSMEVDFTGPLMDMSKQPGQDKYAAFLYGNNGYTEIEGFGTGSILVIKDSYGNSFIPYLLQHYAKVCVMDLRAWTSPDTLINEKNYDEILVLYSFDAFTRDMFANRMMDALQQA